MDTDCEVVLLKCVKLALQRYDCQLQNVQWPVEMFDDFFFSFQNCWNKKFSLIEIRKFNIKKQVIWIENILLTFYIRKEFKNFKIHYIINRLNSEKLACGIQSLPAMNVDNWRLTSVPKSQLGRTLRISQKRKTLSSIVNCFHLPSEA